jgi:DNA modification methylase
MSLPPVRTRTRPAAPQPASSPSPSTNPGLSDPGLTDATLSWADRAKLAIRYVPVAGLRPYARNARRHSKKQIEQIAASVRQFGFVNPILIDQDGEIVAGHGRLLAAQYLDMTEVPVIGIDHLSPEQVRAYRLADNRLAELSDWDEDTLAIELKGLLEIETSFDLQVTGFGMGKIDFLVSGARSRGDDPADAVEAVRELAVTEPGDLWCLGRHRLLCASALERASYTRLLEGHPAQMICTDPPYNLPIKGHVSGLGKLTHREFVMASGEMTAAEFTTFLTTVFGHLAAVSSDGSIHFAFMDWRHLEEILAAGRAAYTELKNLIVWAKDNAGMGAFYRSQHELVFVFKNGTAPHINNFLLGETGRHRTNLWSYPGVNKTRRGREDELGMHPTVKPVALVADAIMDCSKRGGIVLDPFGGSGTTLIAAERVGRRGCLLELDPRYVDVTLHRWERLQGTPARHEATGLTLTELAAQRRGGR